MVGEIPQVRQHMHLLKKLTLIITATFLSLSLSAQNSKQETKDSLVVLLSSKSAQMVDVEGSRYRKVVGPARFLQLQAGGKVWEGKLPFLQKGPFRLPRGQDRTAERHSGF